MEFRGLHRHRYHRYDDAGKAIIITEVREPLSHHLAHSCQNVTQIIGRVLAEVFILRLLAQVPANHNGGLNIDVRALLAN